MFYVLMYRKKKTDVMTDIICTVLSRAEARVTIQEIRSFAF